MTTTIPHSPESRTQADTSHVPAYLKHCSDGTSDYRVWCAYCRRWHSHGAAGGAGHREAHCWTPEGRARFPSGYILAPDGNWTDLTPTEHQRGPGAAKRVPKGIAR